MLKFAEVLQKLLSGYKKAKGVDATGLDLLKLRMQAAEKVRESQRIIPFQYKKPSSIAIDELIKRGDVTLGTAAKTTKKKPPVDPKFEEAVKKQDDRRRDLKDWEARLKTKLEKENKEGAFKIAYNKYLTIDKKPMKMEEIITTYKNLNKYPKGKQYIWDDIAEIEKGEMFNNMGQRSRKQLVDRLNKIVGPTKNPFKKPVKEPTGQLEMDFTDWDDKGMADGGLAYMLGEGGRIGYIHGGMTHPDGRRGFFTGAEADARAGTASMSPGTHHGGGERHGGGENVPDAVLHGPSPRSEPKHGGGEGSWMDFIPGIGMANRAARFFGPMGDERNLALRHDWLEKQGFLEQERGERSKWTSAYLKSPEGLAELKGMGYKTVDDFQPGGEYYHEGSERYPYPRYAQQGSSLGLGSLQTKNKDDFDLYAVVEGREPSRYYADGGRIGFDKGGPLSQNELIQMYIDEGMSYNEAVQAASASQGLPWDLLSKAQGGRVSMNEGGIARVGMASGGLLKWLLSLGSKKPKSLFEIEKLAKKQNIIKKDEVIIKQQGTDSKTGRDIIEYDVYKKSDKQRPPTEDEIEFYMEELPHGGEMDWYDFGTTVDELDKAVTDHKAYVRQMYDDYKTGKLDPKAGERSRGRLELLRERADSAYGDPKMFTLDEMDELDVLEDYFKQVDKEEAFLKAQEIAKSREAKEIARGKASGSPWFKDSKTLTPEEELRREFPGIDDNMIRNILTDTNPQRIAEVKQTMREALEMQEKGMSPDEIIKMFKDTSRTKQASGGIAGQLHLNQGGRVSMNEGGSVGMPPITYGLDFLAQYQHGPSEGNTLGQFKDEVFKRLVPDLGVNYNSPKGWSLGAGPTIGKGDPLMHFHFKKSFDDGGRVRFDNGGFNKGRRNFLKILGGLATIPVLGKYFKLAKPAAKAVKAVEASNAAGMPAWFPKLVDKVMKEGKDVSKQYATTERVVVKEAELPGSKTKILVEQDLTTGDTVVDIGFGKHGWEDGRHGQPTRLHLEKGEWIEPKKGKKGIKTKDEFVVEEAEFTGDAENIKFEETVSETYGNHGSDFTEVEKYATGKNVDKYNVEGTKKAFDDRYAQGRAEADAERWADEADEFAKGGLAHMLGE